MNNSCPVLGFLIFLFPPSALQHLIQFVQTHSNKKAINYRENFCHIGGKNRIRYMITHLNIWHRKRKLAGI